MNYGIELSFNGQTEVIQIPVMPDALEVDKGSNNKTYDVVGLGEVNVIKSPKLMGFSFSSFFPAQRYPFVITSKLLAPSEYVNTIKEWMTARQPIQFKYVSDSYDINTLASIEGFDWKEVAGSSGDIEYSLELKEYVPYTAKTAEIEQSASGATQVTQPPNRPNEQQSPKSYTLVAGDTLWSVAQRFLGNGARWPELQKLNGITDAQIKRLQIGQVINLP